MPAVSWIRFSQSSRAQTRKGEGNGVVGTGIKPSEKEILSQGPTHPPFFPCFCRLGLRRESPFGEADLWMADKRTKSMSVIDSMTMSAPTPE
jgi:hypothetical protein